MEGTSKLAISSISRQTREQDSTNNEIVRQKNRLHKTVSKSVNLQEPIGRKARIARTYWNFFHKHYNEHSLCTWRILCFSRNYNPHNKLVVHWKYKRGTNNTPGMKPQTWPTMTSMLNIALIQHQIWSKSKTNQVLKYIEKHFFRFAILKVAGFCKNKGQNDPKLFLLQKKFLCWNEYWGQKFNDLFKSCSQT